MTSTANHGLFVFILAGILAPSGAGAADPRIRQVELGVLPIAATKLGEPASIEERMQAYGVPGLSIAVIDRGKVAWAKGYGVADIASGRRVRTATLFQAASISKPVSALGVMALVQQGRLRLDSPVNAALTSWKIPDNDLTKQQPVTVRMLLNHSAGLDYPPSADYVPFKPGDQLPSITQVLDGESPAAPGPLRVITVPGTTFAYSGGGYDVLQQLVLDLSKTSFERYMQSAVLGPIGMRDSTFSQALPAAAFARTATGYYAGGQPLPGRFRIGASLAVAGLWTTPSDIAKYIINVQQTEKGAVDAPLSREMVQDMLTPGLGSRGLGPAISGSAKSVRFGHDGFNEGYESSFVAYRDTGRGAVVMANSGFAFMLIKEVLGSISRAYGWQDYGATTQQPPSASITQQRVVPVSADLIDAASGKYSFENIEITLFRRDAHLFLDWPTNGIAEVFATLDGRLFSTPLTFSDVGSPWLALVRGTGGQVEAIRAGDDGSIDIKRVR